MGAQRGKSRFTPIRWWPCGSAPICAGPGYSVNGGWRPTARRPVPCGTEQDLNLRFQHFGSGGRIRTSDLLVMSQAS